MRRSSLSLLIMSGFILLSWPLLLLADADKPEKATDKKTVELPLPAESEHWTIELDGHNGFLHERSYTRWKLSHDGAFEILSWDGKPLKKATLTPDEVPKIYTSLATIMREHDSKALRIGNQLDNKTAWDFTLKLNGDSSSTSVTYLAYKTVEEASPELKEIYKILNKSVPNK